MSAPVVVCPHCDASLKVAFAGKKKIKCPKCGEIFVAEPDAPRRPTQTIKLTDDDRAERATRRRRKDDDGRTERTRPQPKRLPAKATRNPALFWGAIGGGAVAIIGVVIAIVALSMQSAPPAVAQAKPKKPAENSPAKTKTRIDELRPTTDAPPAMNAGDLPSVKETPPVEQPMPVVPEVDNKPAAPPERPNPPANDPAPSEGPKKVPPPEMPDPPAVKDNAPAEEPRMAADPGFDVPLDKNARPMLVTDPGGHSATVKSAIFDPNDETIITVSADKTVRIWEVETGDLLQTFRLPIGPGEEGAHFAGAASRDGRWIAVTGIPVGRGKYGVLIYVMSRLDGRVAQVLKGHKDLVVSLAFSNDSKYLATASTDGISILYDVATGAAVRRFEGHTERLRKVAFSGDDKRLLTASADGTARVWNVATGQTVAVLDKDKRSVLSAAFSPVAPLVATGSVEGVIQLWNLDGTLVKSMPADPAVKVQLVSLNFSPDGKELVYTGVDRLGHAGIVNIAAGAQRLDFKQHSNTVLDGRFSNDGKLIVSSGGDNHETLVWRADDGAVVQRLQGAGKSVWGLGWRLDGKAIGWGNTNGGSTVQATTRLERSFELGDLQFGPTPDKNYGRIALNLNGWSLRSDDFFRVNIFKNGQKTAVFESPLKGDRIYSMSLLPGDRAVIGASFGMYLVDLNANKVIRNYRAHTGLILAVSPSPDGRNFLSGSIDQTICLWDPDKEDPLLSMFMVDREWIVWTPQGYYAASPYGERLMGWQFNNGLGKLATFHPAARFHRSLYNPELIRAIFAEKNFDKALAQVKKKDPATELVNVGKVLPPYVAIVTPTPNKGPIKQAELDVKAKAKNSGAHPVTALRLLVDGRPYRGAESLRKIDNPKLGEVEVVWKIDLLPGKHQLTVIAESSVSKAMSAPVEVSRAGFKKDELPNLFVLAVGVSEYPGDMRLNFAHRDAIVLEKTLKDRSVGVFKKVETVLLTDAKANRKEILKGIDWLEKKMTAKDVAVIFFAGHGDRDRRGQFHFLPVDVDLDRLEESCLAGDLLKTRLANLPGRVVAMLDACHSGAAANAPPPKQALADDFVRDLVSEDYGVIVMCSSQGKEFSLESTETKHGFFTLSLVEALNGKADLNKDRYVYVHEIDLYAFTRVRELSRRAQNPTTGRPPHIRSFPLSSVP